MRFLGLGLNDKVIDAKTIWDFENTLANAEMGEKLFCMFDAELESKGLITHKGTIVEDPKQRNSRDENKKIKNGETPEEWQKPENAHKLAQKDTDARWTKKNNEVHYGYKDQRLQRTPPDGRTERKQPQKNQVRCRFEHIFGFMTGAMHGITIRNIEITRAWFNEFLVIFN